MEYEKRRQEFAKTGMRQGSKFKLSGDDYDRAGVDLWFQEEVKFHDAFEGGRADEYPFFYHHYNLVFGLNELLHAGAKILDFGCAEGLTLTRAPGTFNYHGVDVSNSLLEYARLRNPSGNFKLMGKDQIIPYPAETFDAILCFGVLHHIPNVSFVLSEFQRVLKPGGKVLVREPITDMCKLDGSREGLSPNERGIHPEYFEQIQNKVGLRLVKTELCFFGPLNHLRQRVLGYPSLVRRVIWLDRLISRCFPTRLLAYRRRRFTEKLAPNTAYFLLQKI